MSANRDLHPVLARQLRRVGQRDLADIPTDHSWQELLLRVSRAYTAADHDRYLLESALAASSAEMQQLYDDLRASSETRVAAERDKLRQIITSLGAGLCTLDRELRVQAINPEAERLLGWREGELRGRPVADLLVLKQRQQARALASFVAGARARAYSNTDAAILRRDGASLPVSFVLTPIIEDGALQGAVFVFFDQSERKRIEDQLAYQASHDALTGLPNRALVLDRLNAALADTPGRRNRMALLLLDLDRFKEVNDTYGHNYGDLLLRAVGLRIRNAVRDDDVVARLGGDEFAVFMPDVTTLHDATNTASRILQALDRPFVIEGHTLEIGASIGVAMFPDHGFDPGELLRHADVAMYAAKRNHEGAVVYSQDHIAPAVNHVTLTAELRHAIQNDELVLHYQPKVLLRSRQLCGFEALVRWRHPRLGLVLPDMFIPLAENTGLIKPLTEWVLDTALAQCHQWRELGLDISVAVNLSTRCLHDLSTPDLLQELLGRWNVPAHLLKLEVTESHIMVNPARALEVASRISSLGVGLHIDDFGTGYSSLSQLKRLPIDEIKIDKSFVSGMVAEEGDAIIVRSTIDLAHNLGLSVVAEGVEDEATWRQLELFGCDAVQGYFVCRPLPVAHLGGWLAARAMPRTQPIAV